MVNFSEVAVHLAQSQLVQHSLMALGEMESELLFSIACEKDRIYREKKEVIETLRTVVIANPINFGNISNINRYGEIKILSTETIKNLANDDSLLRDLANSLVITTSNIFSEIGFERLGALYYQLPKTIFAIHDYDNHHWIPNNIQATIFADVYVPSHQDEYLLSSRLNPNIVGGIPCGSSQWTREFINNHAKELVSCLRSKEPLGKYYFFKKFLHRNKCIATLEKIYPSISIANCDFHALTQKQKWDEWSSYRLHWIIPVLNDLPIRFFDALITGGLPLVPGGLKPFIVALDIPEHFYLTYGPLDILNPEALVSRANNVFDTRGASGIIERHQYAMKNFHVDAIIEKITAATYQAYEIKNS